METDTTLYKQAGLSDYEVALLKTPFIDMKKGESSLAIMARDKFDAYQDKKNG